MLLEEGQQDLEVRRHHLQDTDPGVVDRVDEPAGVEDGVLLDEHGPPDDQER
jgi:hypothetical protein